MNNLIVLRLSGGLGNQLFQLAFLEAVSQATSSNILIDSADYFYPNLFRNFTSRRFDSRILLPFYSSFPAIPWPFFKLFKAISSLRLFSHYLPKFYQLISDEDICLRNHNISDMLDEKLLNQKFIYFHGYFQVPYFVPSFLDKYSLHILSTLYNYLSPVFKYSSSSTLSIHIRRGDFLHPSTSGHTFVGASYLQRALEKFFYDNSPISQVFISSDDPIWAYRFVQSFAPRSVNILVGESLFSDFAHMVYSPYKILSNSTLSIWALLLTSSMPDSNNHVVVAPNDYMLLHSFLNLCNSNIILA